MGSVLSTRYSDKDLGIFKKLILGKIEKAKHDLELIKSAYMNDHNNGTEDTAPTFKAFDEGSSVMSKESNSQLALRQEKFIRDLKTALIRIENKTYGVCRVTGKLISKQRLELVPHATLSIEAKFYERFASIFYFISILSLIGLFVFGKTVNGSTSWYGLGSFTIQPSEFAKVATSLAVAKFISDLQTNIKLFNHQVKLLIIIFLPATLIILQNDTGSTLVYLAFFFVLFREGIPKIYLYSISLLFLLVVSTIKFSLSTTFLVSLIILLISYIRSKKKRNSLLKHLGVLLIAVTLSTSINYFYNNVIKQHQKNRISLWLRLENNPEEIEKMKNGVNRARK